MKVTVTIGTTYCGCPSESFEIECKSEEDFVENDKYSTEILDAILEQCSHYFINYDWDEENEDDDDDWDEDDKESEEDYD